jgi:hypothetical protein
MQDWSHNAAAFTNSKQTGRVIQITLLRYANLRGVPTHLSTVLHTVWAGWILSLVTFGYIVLKNIWIYSVRNILYYRYMDWIPPPVWGLVRPIGDVIRTIGNRLTSIRQTTEDKPMCPTEASYLPSNNFHQPDNPKSTEKTFFFWHWLVFHYRKLLNLRGSK